MYRTGRLVLAASANDADFCTSPMSPVLVLIYFRHKCAAAKLITVLISNCIKIHITFCSVLLHTLYFTFTLTLLKWGIWWAPNNASSWLMHLISTLKCLKYSSNPILLTWSIWWDPKASRWQMGNSAIKWLKEPLNLILLTWSIWWDPNNSRRWQMGFISALKLLIYFLTLILETWSIWWSPNKPPECRWVTRRLNGWKIFQPLSCYRGVYGEFLMFPADGRRYLTPH